MDRITHEQVHLYVYHMSTTGHIDDLLGTQDWSAAEMRDALNGISRWQQLSYSSLLKLNDQQTDALTLQTAGREESESLHPWLLNELMETDFLAYQATTNALQWLDALEVHEQLIPDRPPTRIVGKVRLEEPLYRQNSDWKVGNVDVLVPCQFPRMVTPELLLRPFTKDELGEVPMLIEIVWGRTVLLEFECKSVIVDIGATLRQLYDHRKALPRGTMQYVVSPDTRYQEILEAQGFGFIRYVRPDEPDEELPTLGLAFD